MRKVSVTTGRSQENKPTKIVPLWNEIYNHEATTSQEQAQLRELEEIMKNAWEKLGQAINDLFKE